MKHQTLVVTTPVLAVAAFAFTAAEASAELPAEKDGFTVVAGVGDEAVIAPRDPGGHPPYEPAYVAPQPATDSSTDSSTGVDRTGAAVLTGAAAALTGGWFYRRRHTAS